MAFTAGDIVKDTLAWWNRPSEQELPVRDLVTIINRKVNRLLLLLQLSDKNYLAKLSDPITFNGLTRELTDISDLSSIVRVESRSIGADDQAWSEETVGDYGSWNDAMDSRTDQVAFYGSGDSLMMAVNRDVSSMEFRILYETGGVSLSGIADAVPSLQDFFRSTVFYGTAAEAGMQLHGLNEAEQKERDKKVGFLVGKEIESVDEFRRWMLNSPGQSVAFREAFDSTRNDLGSPKMLNINNEIAGYYSRY
jgi:hypothetical protein